jgi:hypothetical protein
VQPTITKSVTTSYGLAAGRDSGPLGKQGVTLSGADGESRSRGRNCLISTRDAMTVGNGAAGQGRPCARSAEVPGSREARERFRPYVLINVHDIFLFFDTYVRAKYFP